MTAPLEEGRVAKRQRSSLEPADTMQPNSPLTLEEITMADGIVEIIPDGDPLLCLDSVAGSKTKISLRVSSHALSMASPVFKTELAGVEESVSLPGDDGDAMLLLCNILHLQNNHLPARIPAELLFTLASLAAKYQCAVAVGRATTQWFDRLYHFKAALDNFRMIQTAYILDEPTYFTRFAERWIRSEPVTTTFVTRSTNPTALNLAQELRSRRTTLYASVRADLDFLVDPCSLAFSKETEHYIDYAPGMSPDETTSLCHVDEGAGTAFLGALRDERIWPPTVWPTTLGAIRDAIKGFRVPAYDDCDKCEFCDDTKIKFSQALSFVKLMHMDRLWGMCLDCFKAGGVHAGECRYDHGKPKT